MSNIGPISPSSFPDFPSPPQITTQLQQNIASLKEQFSSLSNHPGALNDSAFLGGFAQAIVTLHQTAYKVERG